MVENFKPQDSQTEVDFLRCNNADIDWYMRMPRDPTPVHPKVEMQFELCKEDNATPELTYLAIEISAST